MKFLKFLSMLVILRLKAEESKIKILRYAQDDGKLYGVVIFIFLIILSGTLSFASDKKNVSHPKALNSFSRIAIQEQGRIKPLDTYARTVLLQFSGKQTFDKKPAIHWLANVLFFPAETIGDKVFLISNPEIPMALGFQSDIHRRYSFSQLESSLDKFHELAIAANAIDQKQRSVVEHEILRVYNNIIVYLEICNTFSFAVNAAEHGLAIFPSTNSIEEAWQSAGQVNKYKFNDGNIRNELGLIKEMSREYINKNPSKFNLAVQNFNNSVFYRIPDFQKNAYYKIPFEIFYNQSNLFSFAKIFYVFGFFAFLFSLIWHRVLVQKAGFILLGLGFFSHLSALSLRMFIMSRPPVTNLYETFVFVGVISVFLGLLIEWHNKKWLGIVAGSVSGFIFLSIAEKFSADGDTLKMLVAVLDSNFWLTTHVLSITIGYSGCCVAGIMGHVYILQALFDPKNKDILNATYRYILGILGFGLTMTFLGTILGGIWADQSWGRFWGWDPKENGALLIILWTAIIFHAKIGKLINPLGVAVGAVLGLIVVLWAWFGVNVLSIGLHSYGFTSGILTNLVVYVALEILFLFTSIVILGKRGSAV